LSILNYSSKERRSALKTTSTGTGYV